MTTGSPYFTQPGKAADISMLGTQGRGLQKTQQPPPKKAFLFACQQREHPPEQVKTSILAFKKDLKGKCWGHFPWSKETPPAGPTADWPGSSEPPEGRAGA